MEDEQEAEEHEPLTGQRLDVEQAESVSQRQSQSQSCRGIVLRLVVLVGMACLFIGILLVVELKEEEESDLDFGLDEVEEVHRVSSGEATPGPSLRAVEKEKENAKNGKEKEERKEEVKVVKVVSMLERIYGARCSVEKSAEIAEVATLQRLVVSPHYEEPTQVRLSLTSCPTELMVHFTIVEKLANSPPAKPAEGDRAACDTDIPANTPFVIRYGLENSTSVRTANAMRIGCVHYEATNEIWHFYASVLTNLDPPHLVHLDEDEAAAKVSRSTSTNGASSIRTQLKETIESYANRYDWYNYTIGQIVPEAMATKDFHFARTLRFKIPRFHLSPDKNIPQRVEEYVLVGDMDMRGSKGVFDGISQTNGPSNFDLFIHLGDSSYATNNGQCYNNDPVNCVWDCPHSNPKCGGRDRQSQDHYHKWKNWFPHMEQISTVIPWMTTTGNHDNDLTWFLKFRPPLNSSMANVQEIDVPHLEIEGLDTLRTLIRQPSGEAQIVANDLMNRPSFYSYDFGSVHFVAFGTEDNAINPYEMWNGETHTPAQLARFELHYGRNSSQYKWLRNDLARARSSQQRAITPWLVLYTHRPIYSASSHHPMCSPGGDWYACMFRDLYTPIFDEFNVSLIFSGHSHNYQRTLPIRHGEVSSSENGVIYIVCGTGGFELSGGFRNDKKVAFKQGSKYGFCKLKIMDSKEAILEYFGVGDNGNLEALDKVTITNQIDI